MKKQISIFFKNMDWRAFIILAVYIVFISYRLFFYAYTDNIRHTMKEISYNLLPFKTIIDFFINSQNVKPSVLAYNLAGNVAAFVPLGFLLPAAFKKLRTLKLALITAFILIFVAESMQLVTQRGVFDVDDIILNLIGTIIGFYIYNKLKKTVRL